MKLSNFFYVILIIVAYLLLFSCNSSKIAARKDAAAVERVLGNYSLQQPIINSYMRSHPQQTDTIVGPAVILPGEVITKTLFLDLYRSLDTTIDQVHIRVDTTGRISLTVKASKPDTMYKPQYIHDLSAQQRALDSAQYYRLLSQANYSQFLNSSAQFSQYKIDSAATLQKVTRKNTIFLTMLIAIAVIVVGYNAIKLYKTISTGGVSTLIKKL